MIRVRRSAVGIVLAACSLAFNSVHAHAATYQVASPGQPGNDLSCTPCSTIAGALTRTQIMPGTDTIKLGAGTYNEAVSITVGNPVNLVGNGMSGPNATTLGSNGAQAILSIDAGSATDLRVLGNDDTQLVTMSGGLLRRVHVSEPVANHSVSAISVFSGGVGAPTIADSTVDMPDANGWFKTWGISTMGQATNLTITNSQVTADAVLGISKDATITATRLVGIGRSEILSDQQGGTADLRSSLFRVTNGSLAFTLFPHDGSNRVSNLWLRNCTVVGTGADFTTAISVLANTDNNSAHLHVDSSVIHGFHTHLYEDKFGTGSATSEITNSFFNDLAIMLTAGVNEAPQLAGNVFSLNPGFVNEAAHDYRPLPGSILVDAGKPGLLGADDPAVDVRGLARRRDGNGDGVVRRDIGAFEYQPAPKASKAPAATGILRVGRRLTCTMGTWSNAGAVTIGFRWYRGSTPIAGASKQRYRLTAADRGKRVSCKEIRTTVDNAAASARSAKRRVSS